MDDGPGLEIKGLMHNWSSGKQEQAARAPVLVNFL